MIPPESPASALAQKWGFTASIELPGGFCSRVYADADRVLKVPFQGEEMTHGWRAAQAMSGVCGPAIYEVDEATGAVLMERVCPGSTLASAQMDDLEAAEITVGFIKCIQGLPTEGLLNLSGYYSSKLPLLDELLRTAPAPVHLHGDLHHYNILLGESGWVPIDPKGIQGDPAFEPVAFLRNPIENLAESLDLKGRLLKRIHFFADTLNLDPWRIAAWLAVDFSDASAEEFAREHPWSLIKALAPEIEAELRPARRSS